MLFNCLTCGKCISSRKELCPYCMCDISEVSQTLESEKPSALKGILKERFGGTLFSSIIGG